MLEALKKAFENPDVIERINRRIEIENKIRIIEDSQLERFWIKISNDEIDFNEVVKKVCLKYDSDDYYFRWMNRGIMPQEMLYFFLFDFASVYGRELSNEEYEKFANDFESGIYIYGNYVFQKMNGQGTCIRIDELK
jgi:hypothetical protein